MAEQTKERRHEAVKALREAAELVAAARLLITRCPLMDEELSACASTLNEMKNDLIDRLVGVERGWHDDKFKVEIRAGGRILNDGSA